MTNRQQPDALEIASIAESADLAGYPTAKKANAYYLCLLEDCAQMIRRLHAENETLRASHGQAPAQAAPAAVAGPKKWAPEEVEDGERGIRWVTNEGIHGRPTDHDVREYLKRTPTANGCLCDECKVFYAAAPTTQPAPQQEAREIVEIPKQCLYFGPSPHRDIWLDGWYAASASTAAQGDAQDAARYRYLRDVPMDQWPAELLTAIRLQQNAKWDTNIDAARKQGANHD